MYEFFFLSLTMADLRDLFNCSATSESLFAEDVRTDHLSASIS